MERKKERSGRNCELDLWKLIFMALIVAMHSSQLPVQKESSYIPGASIGVEFFFLLSGFFVARAADRASGDLTEATWKFFIHKVSSFYPYYIAVTALMVVAKTILAGEGIRHLIKNACIAVLDLLLLTSTGIGNMPFNWTFWYFSAMMLSGVILFFLAAKYGKQFTGVVAPLLGVFILGYLCKKYGNVRNPEAWSVLFNKGFMRSFAEMSLGMFVYEISPAIERIRFTKMSKAALTAFAYGSCIGICCYSTTKDCFDMDYPSVFLLLLSLLIMVSGKSVLAPLWDKMPFSQYWGKFSLMLYIFHFPWVTIFRIIKGEMPYEQMFWLYMACSTFSAIIGWMVVDVIMNFLKKQSVKKLFLEKL